MRSLTDVRDTKTLRVAQGDTTHKKPPADINNLFADLNNMKYLILSLIGITLFSTACKGFRALSHEEAVAMYQEAEAIDKHLNELLPKIAEQKEELQQMMNRMQIAAQPMNMEKFELWQKLQLELGEVEREINELEDPSDSGSVKDFERQQAKFQDLQARADELVNRVEEVIKERNEEGFH